MLQQTIIATNKMMDETLHCPTTNKLLQGDILRFERPYGTNSQFSLGVIINADCDMANNKTDGVIAFLPIYKFEDYLKEFWLPSFIAEQKNNSIARLKELCTYTDAHVLDLIRWINGKSDEEVSAIAKQVADNNSPHKKDVQPIKESIQKISFCINEDNFNSLACIKRFAPDNSDKRTKYVRNQILEAKKNMGDGHFFVSEIKGDDDIGFVVRMRRIYSLDARRCFRSESELITQGKSNGICAARISKFSPHYQFKLSQMFAHQYSRIGLPDEISALSDLAIENIHNLILEAA